MRSRNIKPGFFKNELIAQLDPLNRLLFVALWCLADREGRLENRPLRIKAEAFPYDSLDIALAVLELEKKGLINIYTIDGNSYINIPNFKKHQRPHVRESKSDLPSPRHSLGIAKDKPRIIQGALIPDVLIHKTKSATQKTFNQPTPEEVEAYALSIGYKLDGHKFCDYYAARAWKMGKVSMKDWKAAVRTWKRNDEGTDGTGTAGKKTTPNPWGH